MADISIRKVRKSYGKDEVVHGVDLDIRNGEFVVILGPSGCGKSTLLRMIAGLEDISGGEIAIADQVVNALEPRERGCAMVFQNYALYPHMTVAENIGYALRVAGMPKAERRKKVEEVAASVGLMEFLERRPGQLSGGQRQRVAMARAIIREPKVFLFDEPLSNLDAKLRVQMRHEIRRIHNRIGATSVFVTHDQHEGMTLADRIVIMNKGTIEQVGTPSEIYHNPGLHLCGRFRRQPGHELSSCTNLGIPAGGDAWRWPDDSCRRAGRCGAGWQACPDRPPARRDCDRRSWGSWSCYAVRVRRRVGGRPVVSPDLRGFDPVRPVDRVSPLHPRRGRDPADPSLCRAFVRRRYRPQTGPHRERQGG